MSVSMHAWHSFISALFWVFTCNVCINACLALIHISIILSAHLQCLYQCMPGSHSYQHYSEYSPVMSVSMHAWHSLVIWLFRVLTCNVCINACLAIICNRIVWVVLITNHTWPAILRCSLQYCTTPYNIQLHNTQTYYGDGYLKSSDHSETIIMITGGSHNSQVGLYTVIKVLHHIYIIKLILVSLSGSNTFHDDINKNRAILTQK